MNTRIDAIRREIRDRGADGALVTALHDIRWAVGFTGSSALLLVLGEAAHFITDGRYAEQSEGEVEGAAVHVPGYRLYEHLATLLPAGATVLRQADSLTLADATRLEGLAPETTWLDATDLVTPLAAQKTEAEIGAIARAQAITDAVFDEIRWWIKPGTTEQEVAAEIVYRHLQKGAQRMSFEPIVASGPQSALPHARPTSRVLQAGELLLLDFGCVVDGYASDMTRTVALGEVGAQEREVYEIVLRAQEAALDAARAGLTAAELDAAAREVIADAGYGEQFVHSLGHGVGLRTHEWPRLSQQNPSPLPAGCVVTIEPGIYLPGRFGVRIEDLIVIEEGGARNLTASPKSLLVL